ncbi:MAG: nitroreductase family protein [Dehalococcoidia bacterium]
MSQQSGALLTFLRSLRAVREYTPEPIADDVVRDILEVGRWSGSASNRQPVELVVVRDKGILQQITEHGVRAAAGAPLALLIVTPGDPERRELEIFDDGRLVERLLLAAKAHGLGSNVSTLKGEGPSVIKHALGIPAERRVWTVVTIGHIDQEARRARTQSPAPGRKQLEEFAHWDRY